MKYYTNGGPRVHRPDGTVVAKAYYIDAERFADELNEASEPKMMKRYTEDCKPNAAGWYWALYEGCFIIPAYCESGGYWYDSGCCQQPLGNPDFWLEMELPTIPSDEK